MNCWTILAVAGVILCEALGSKPPEIEKSCWGQPAVDMDVEKLNGLWYIQAYTMPGGFNSRCETSNYTIEVGGQGGEINSTFVSTTSNEAVSVIRQFAKKQDGESFRYVIGDAGKSDIDASVKILSFQEDDHYLACVTVPTETEFSISVLATRERKVSKSKLKKMIARDGSTDYKYLIYFVDQDSCNDIKHLEIVD